MTKLYEYTEAQAEAMSARNAVKVLAENKEVDYGEATERELYGYALEYGDDGKPMKDSQGNYVVVSRGYDVPEAPKLWRHWSKIYSQDKMMDLTVGEAMSLHPKVKEILEKKAATMDAGRRRKSRKGKKSRRRVTRKH
jgi:hypothetical protein